MALIRRFEHKAMERNALHDEIEATYSVFKHDDQIFMQIDSYGRPNRENPGKKSQTIQLDREGARNLYEIIKHEFKF